ncbi:MAG: tetratricopeptide repeat protein [Lachnospiraceae bacterium]|jgi:tetratricopeptide (TPR) repeat protein|nr:tetratricopeptide repeat protein [Lachnospiraceae bacterium]MCX4316711.1 tetratricopeptide repeat protein [Lachnospiraceae bacterium]
MGEKKNKRQQEKTGVVCRTVDRAGRGVCFLLICLLLSACGGKSAGDYYKEGVKLMEQKKYEEAEQSFSEAIKKNPDRAEYYLDYGFALIGSGKIEDALIQFDKGYSNKDNQIVRENNKRILRGKGIAYSLLNQYEEAKQCMEQALEIKEVKELNRDILAYLGQACRKLGDYERALKVYTTLIEEKKSDAAAYAGRAEVYALSGEMEKAVSDYDAAIALDSTNFSCYFGKYNLYAAAGMETEAKAVLSAAYALKTTTNEDYYNLAIIHYLSGDYDVALVEMEEALRNGFAEANYYLGSIYHQKKDWENAFYYYNQYAETVNTISVAAFYEGMADCYQEQWKYEEALEAIENGLKLQDRNSEASFLYRKVYLYEQQSDFVKAAESAKEYLELVPEDTAMQKELIFLQSRIGEKSEEPEQETSREEETDGSKKSEDT